jgi:hypothetical protein
MAVAALCLLWPGLEWGELSLSAYATDLLGAAFFAVALLLQRSHPWRPDRP